MSGGAVVQFVSHASVLIRHGDDFLLTDPWYLSPAFTSWTPCPPPSVNPEIIEALSRTGKLALVLSHAHPDHTDLEFLKRLDPQVPVYIPTYGDTHFTTLLATCGLKNVVEIPDSGLTCGAFTYHYCPHIESRFDAIISIECPDAFILHGNDAWVLGADGKEKIRRIKPAGKPSLFMGQGGSASGHPLTYMNYPPEQRGRLLREKNEKMLRNIAAEARAMGFDRALAYACFTRIQVPGKAYAFEAPVQSGRYANQLVGRDIFIDLSPGDIYLPAEDRTVPILSSLHWPMEVFAERPVRTKWPRVSRSDFLTMYVPKARSFLDALAQHLTEMVRSGRAAAEALNVRLRIDVALGAETVWAGTCPLAATDGAREKICRVEAPVFAAMLDREIPFEDLYTGYLAEWSRQPEAYYNSAFIRALIDFGYLYFEGQAAMVAAE